jgi:hypothetical protein
VRKFIICRRASKFKNKKKATSRIYRKVLSPLQKRNLFKRIAPPAKRTPGIVDTKITKAAALHRSDPLGAREINGANRDKKIEEKKRKIKYGLYG